MTLLTGRGHRVLEAAEEDRTPGYIFLEVDGNAVCVWEADFERIENGASVPV